MNEPEVIGFIIEGDNIVVANPCTIPIEMLTKALRIRRKEGEVTFIGEIMIKFEVSKKRQNGKRKKK